VANQHPAHEPHKADPHKAEPHKAEPHKADSAHPAQQDVPPPQQMEVGGTGTAKVSFTDVNGADVPLVSSTWTASGPVTVTPDDKDPTSATLEATAPGRGSVTATVMTEAGAQATAAVEVMVIETGTPAEGTIELTLQPAKAKAKAKAA
jgi:hypothetical protein